MLIARRTFWTTPPRSMCEISRFFIWFSPTSVGMDSKIDNFQAKFCLSKLATLTNRDVLSNFDISKLFVCVNNKKQIERV